MTGLFSIVTTETSQWLTMNTVFRVNVLFFRNNLHNKKTNPVSTLRLDDNIHNFYLKLLNLICKPAYVPDRIT